MIDHRRAIDLAATAIDFPIDDADRRLLDEHLRACAQCRADAAALRVDAAALSALPAIEPPLWVRRAIGQLRGLRRGVILLAAALVLAATVGVTLAVGAAIHPDLPPTISPSPATSAVISTSQPSFGGPESPSPRVAPSPSASPGSTPPVSTAPGTPVSFPAASGTAWIGAGPEGGVWVLADHSGGVGADAASVSTLGLVEASGRPRPGWPIALRGWRCGEDAPPHRLAVAADGSIRLVCAQDAPADAPQRHVAFAFDPDGHALPGWPVELPASDLSLTPVVVGNDLRILAQEIASTDGSTSQAQPAAWWLVDVSAAGEIRIGRRYEVADAAGGFDVRIASNGIAYRVEYQTSAGTTRTIIDAFDLDGVRPGWPATIPGLVSHPAVGPDGSVVVVRLDKTGPVTAQTWRIDSDGVAVATSADLPLDPLDDRTGAGSVLLAPIVSADGSLWVVGTDRTNRTAVVRIVPGAGASPSMRLAMPLQPEGTCSPQDTGCGVWRSVPAIAADGTLYVPESVVGEGGGLSASAGGSLVAIGTGGHAPAGWPIALADPMAGYWSLLPRADGTVDAFAVTPTDRGNQWTLVMVGHDGKTAASIALIVP